MFRTLELWWCNLFQIFWLLFVTKVIAVCWQFPGKTIQILNYLLSNKQIVGSISEGAIKISMQSLGFFKLILEATHIIGACLDHMYIKNTQSNFSSCEVKKESVYYSDHDPVFLYCEHILTKLLWLKNTCLPDRSPIH